MNSIFSKQNDIHFSVKGVYATKLKQKDRWVFIVIQKSAGDTKFATYQCTTGRAGACTHANPAGNYMFKVNNKDTRTMPLSFQK